MIKNLRIKNIIVLKALVYLLVLLSITPTSSANDWKFIKEVIVPINKFYLIKISEISIDSEIKILSNNGLFSIQNKPLLIDSDEYIFLEQSPIIRHISIFYKSKNLNTIDFTPSVSYFEIFEKEVNFYRLLSKVSENWHKKNLVLLDKLTLQIENYEIINDSEFLLIIYQLSILDNFDKFNDILSIVDKIDFNKINDFKIKVKLLWFKAIANLNIGKFKKSAEVFNNIITHLNEIEGQSNSWLFFKARVYAYNGLALSMISYFNKNIKDDGIFYINLALETIDNVKHPQIISEILYIKGSYLGTKNKWRESIDLLLKSEKYSLDSNTDNNLAGIYNQLAISYKRLNILNKALFYFRKSLNVKSQFTNEITNANLLVNIAKLYEISGDLNQASRYYDKALIKFRKKNINYGIVKVLNSRGNIERRLGHYEKAIKLHESSVDYFSGDKDKLFIQSLLELSIDYYHYSKYNEAEKYSLITIILFNYTNIDQNSTLNNTKNDTRFIFNQYKKLLNMNTSELYIILFKLNDNHSVLSFSSYIILMNISLKSDQEFYDSNIIKIDSLAKNETIPILDKLAYFRLKITALKLDKEYKELDLVANKAINLINFHRNKFDISNLGLYWTTSANIILDEYIESMLVQDKENEIFKVLENFYSINLREKRFNSTETLNSHKASNIQNALDNYIKLERETILKKDESVQNQADEAKEHFLTLDGLKINQFEPKPLNYLSIAKVQEKLEIDELLLRYYINDKNSFVFVIDKTSSKFFKIPTKEQLNQLVKNILNTIKSKKFTDLSKTKKFLAQILPIKKIDSGQYKKLIIIPDGVLNLLPFGALNSRHNDNYQPLATSINIERTYSASDYFSRINIPKINQSVSVFANPVFIGNANENIQSQFKKDNKLWEFKALPYSEKEAIHIQEIFSDVIVNIMSGKEASNDNFMSEKTRNSNIIHIATHGFFNESNMEDVGIATTIVEVDKEGVDKSSAGILAMREILYKPFRANLVVISGCETTHGKEISGEGFNSLSRGLLSQGVGSVIGTIWSISDRATPIFMKEFYTNLKAMDGNVSKALNASKVNFATQPKYRRYRHPYYWAGFVLTSSNRGISENIF